MNARSTRTEFLSGLAKQLQLGFNKADDERILGYLKGFGLFRRGSSKKMYNILSYTDEDLSEKYFFDYEYTIRTNNSKKTYRQSVFFLNSKNLYIPSHKLKPEHFGHMIQKKLFGMIDIDFVGFPVFSKNYLLKGDDEELIRDSYSDDILKYFSENTGWTVEGVNYFLIMYFSKKLVKQSHYHLFLRECETIGDFFIRSSKKFKTDLDL